MSPPYQTIFPQMKHKNDKYGNIANVHNLWKHYYIIQCCKLRIRAFNCVNCVQNFNQIENSLNIKKVMSKNAMYVNTVNATCVNYNVLNAVHVNAVNANCNDHFHTYMFVWNLWNFLTIATFLVEQYFSQYVNSSNKMLPHLSIEPLNLWFQVQHSPFSINLAFACKTETFGSLCSHVLLIITKSSMSKNQVVHKQKFKDLLSSTCQISSERRVLDLESEVCTVMCVYRTFDAFDMTNKLLKCNLIFVWIFF